MSLRILLADDSMTAQNMGKKILSDAGYEVVAVSNGAAALKKAIELKPDLVVLDIYMPGYTGLDVCERLKANPDTSAIPVILTVGKLEPYRPEDGARVRAEGVIIKPFEATDLLAAIKKITSKPAVEAKSDVYEETLVMKRPPAVQEFQDATYTQWKAESPDETEQTVKQPPAVSAMDQTVPIGYHLPTPSQSAPPPAPAPANTAFERTMLISPPVAQSRPPAPAAPSHDDTHKSMPPLSSERAFEVPPPPPPPPVYDVTESLGYKNLPTIQPPYPAEVPAAPAPAPPTPIFDATQTISYPPAPVAPAPMPAFDMGSETASPMPAFSMDPLGDLNLSSVPPSGENQPGIDLYIPDLPVHAAPPPASGSAIDLDFLGVAPEAKEQPAAPAADVPVAESVVDHPAPPQPVVPIAAPEPGGVLHELEPTSAPKVGRVELELEQLLEPGPRHEDVQLDTVAVDPDLVTDPAELASFAVKVGTTDSAFEIMQHDPLNKVAPLDEEPEPIPEPEPESAAASSVLNTSYFALEDTQPIPQVPEHAPEGAGAAAIDLFHEEYGPAADGSIDLSVPERQQAVPPPNAPYAGMRDELGLEDIVAPPLPETHVAASAPKPEPKAEPEPVFDPMHMPVSGYEQVAEPVAPSYVAPEVPATPVTQSVPAMAVPPPPVAEEPAPLLDVPVPSFAQPAPAPEPPPEVEVAPEPEAHPVVEPAPVIEPVLPVETVVADYSYAENAPLDLSTMSPEVPAEAPVAVPEPPPLTQAEIMETAPHLVEAPVPEPAPLPAAVQTLRVEDKEFAAAMAAALDAVEQEPGHEAAFHEAETPPAIAAPEAEKPETISALDRSYVAGVVQRVVDRYKTQIIADITRELMKHND